MIEINSSENKKIKRLKSLDRKKVRDKQGLFLIEGKIMINEAIEQGCNLKGIYVGNSYYEKNKEYIDELDKSGYHLMLLNDNLFKHISDTTSPQGILAEVEFISWDYNTIKHPVIILDAVSDPGNVGTIVRTAEAFGFSAILAREGTADIYNSKTVRSTMGSIFRMPYFNVQLKDITNLECEIYGMDLEGESLDLIQNINKKCAIVIGNEANGISNEIKNICTRKISIPMKGANESLNASVAAAIVMYTISKL